VALLVVLALGLSGVLTPRETFEGFSRSAAITIIAVYILAEGLLRTGVTDQAGRLLVRVVGRKERWLAVAGMIAAAFLSLVMNNIAAASVILPVISGAARKLKANPAKLLMPMAFGTIFGGMATLLTTTNIVVSGLLRDQGLQGYGVFDFAPLGLPLVIVGIAYMASVGYWMLPSRSLIEEGDEFNVDRLVEIYRMQERLIRCRIKPDSPLVGQRIANSNLRSDYNLNVVAIERNGHTIFSPQPDYKLAMADVLVVTGRLEELPANEDNEQFEALPVERWPQNIFASPDTAVVEALLTPRSTLIDQSLRMAHFREKFNMNVLGIYRAGQPIRTGLSDLTLQFGDALLLQGPRQQVQILRREPDLIILYADNPEIITDHRKAPLALGIMLLTLAVATLPQAAIHEVMLAGGILMVLSKVLNMDQAYQSIDWKTVFLVAGMLPLGTAMTKSGAAAGLADKIMQTAGGFGPLVLLAVVMVITIGLTLVMHGAVAAAIMAPIAIHLAQSIGVDPRSLAMGVALATSMAFITPLGHPVNLLVMSPGGYTFKDFMKIGLPLTVIFIAIILLLLPIFWPLVPASG
jgi:di/tricarboxylate transporter